MTEATQDPLAIPPTEPIAHPAPESCYPCSLSQEPFWALHQLEPASGAGNEAIALRIRGALRVDSLLGSIRALAGHYDAWHGRFVLDARNDGACPQVVVDRSKAFPVEQLELRADAVAEFLAERARRPFDLEREDAVRIALVRIANDDHLLLTVAHHVAFDGVSLFRLWPEHLAKCYAALLRGGPPYVPQGPRYEEFAREQRRRTRDERRAALAHWERALAGATVGVDLPGQRRHCAVPTPRARRGKRLYRGLGPTDREALEAGARALGGSLSDLLLSAYALTLARHGRQTDLTIGVANANRRDPRFVDLFGCLMITAPVRVELADSLTARELLSRVRAAKRGAFAHLDAEVANLTSCAVLFNFMDFSHRAAQLEGLSVEAIRPDPGWASAELSLDVALEGEALAFTVEHDTDLFTTDFAEALLTRTLHAAHQLIANGAVRIGEIDVLDEAERAGLIALGCGAGEASLPGDTVIDLLATAALASAESTALVCGAEELSYRQLANAAVRIAERMRPLIPSAGGRVAVMIEDPLLCVIAFLGVLTAGGSYVPIDPALPAARRRWMFEASSPCAILTDSTSPPGSPNTVPVVRAREALLASPATSDWAAPHVPADSAAYVIFTSGSTGSPKGVVISHRNLSSQLGARLTSYPKAPGRMLVNHSFAFDAAVAGLYWVLATGGTLVLPDPAERSDPVAVRRLIRRHRVAMLDIPPSLYAELLASDVADDLRTLEGVIVGGESCTPALVRAHQRQLPRASLWNEYGPTEATVFATVAEVSGLAEEESVPIGRPIANTRCYVLDERCRLAPRGVTGELYLGGDCVSPGYLGELSSDRFVPDPFTADETARMFRTGDLVRWDSDGQLHFLGREDRQIKLRGHRVELSEIDAALCRIPGVAHAVSVARGRDSGGYVDSYVVLEAWCGSTGAAVRQALRETIPEYMVPRHVEPIAALPIAASGKVDIAALPAPSDGSQLVSQGSRAAESETERRVARYWQSLLEIRKVRVTDDFFDLGGHSLLAVRMLAWARQEFGVDVPLARFTRAPTIERLATLLQDRRERDEEPLVVDLRPDGDRAPLWLIHAVGGHVVFGRSLLPYLDPEQPLLGIQAQGLDGRRAPHRSVEAMSDLYTKLIVERQPSGPYLLSGSSLGGLIAREAAARLRASGREVRLTALFDTPGPNYPRRTLLRRGLSGLRAQWRRLRSSSQRRASQLGLTPGHPIDIVSESLEAAADRFVPTFQPGPLHVFRASRTPDGFGVRYDDPTCGWAPISESVEVIPVECTHETMFAEPHVAEVGRKLHALLAQLAKPGKAVLIALAIALQVEPPCDWA